MSIQFFIHIILYSLLGLALGAIEITIIKNPVSFLTILMLVLLIDFNGNRK